MTVLLASHSFDPLLVYVMVQAIGHLAATIYMIGVICKLREEP